MSGGHLLPDDALYGWWQPQPWAARAACKDSDPTWFDEPSTDPDADVNMQVANLRNAATLCASCPVRQQCRAMADAHRLTGVWGGFLILGGPGRHTVDLVSKLHSSAWWFRYAAQRRYNERKRQQYQQEQERTA